MQQNAFDLYSIEELYDLTDMDIDIIDEDNHYKDILDYLNQDNSRNTENTFKGDYNCGGLALNTFNWYKPYEGEFEWREQLLFDWASEYYDHDGELVAEPCRIVEELEDRLLTRDVLYMLRQFKGKLRRVKGRQDLWEGERLIAYRIGIQYVYDEVEQVFSEFDIDFHYRYYDEKTNCWIEKNGGGPVRCCIEDEEENSIPWREFFWTYTSDVVYLALQLS